MKRTYKQPLLLALLGAVFCVLAVPGDCFAKAPWGLVSEYGEQDPEDANFSNTDYVYFATHKMLTDTPIKYAIKFSDYEGRTPQTDQQWIQKMDVLIRTAFNRWPKSVAQTIHSSGRAAQFQDVLNTLKQHPLILQRTAEKEADIVFHFDEYKSAAFLFDKNDLSAQKTIRLPNPAYFGPEQEKHLPHYLAHEIGHFYGLGDRYQEGIEGSSPLYSTTEGTDGTALMAIAKKPDITPDDVDGFINLMDVTQAFTARRFNKRAEKGWASFVSPKRLYARGKELNRQAFFDGHTIYYYNPDGSIKNRQPAETKAEYNPFAEAQAKQGPFRSVQHIPSTKTNIETFFDYTKLDAGRFSATSRIANLTMLTLEGKKSGSHKWDLQFNYERSFNGYADKRQQRFIVQTGPETCRIQALSYGDSLQNIQTELNPKTGQFSLNGQAKDSPPNNTPFELQASGTEQDVQFVYTQGKQAYHIRWKDDSLYRAEELDTTDDQIFFVTDNMHVVRKVLEDELHFCQYFQALENSSKNNSHLFSKNDLLKANMLQ